MIDRSSPVYLRSFARQLSLGGGAFLMVVMLMITRVKTGSWLGGLPALSKLWWLWALLGIVLVLGELCPRILAPLEWFWMRVLTRFLAATVGFVIGRLLLALVFYLVLTPIGWLQRLRGADPLRLTRTPGGSMWIERKETRQKREKYERQF